MLRCIYFLFGIMSIFVYLSLVNNLTLNMSGGPRDRGGGLFLLALMEQIVA